MLLVWVTIFGFSNAGAFESFLVFRPKSQITRADQSEVWIGGDISAPFSGGVFLCLLIWLPDCLQLIYAYHQSLVSFTERSNSLSSKNSLGCLSCFDLCGTRGDRFCRNQILSRGHMGEATKEGKHGHQVFC